MRHLFRILLAISIVAIGGLLLTRSSDDTTPGPLRITLPKKPGVLTIAGIVTGTNQQRTAAKVSPLAHNTILDQAAQRKADDILARQYFGHVAPDGTGPADLVKGVGYTYLRVGENLALGAFPNDATLVQAWMDSPGHRANILSPRFTEIGIGITRGRFEGDDIWVAVQTFATPASTCPAPSNSEKTTIEARRAELEQLAAELEQEHATLTAQTKKINQGHGSPEEIEAFRARQTAYNNQVSYFQALQADLHAMIDTLNKAIRQYNACLNR